MNTLKGSFLVGACSFLVGLSACQSPRSAQTHRTAVEHELLVTVTELDVPNRLVTVRDASGDHSTFYVDRSNKNFPQAGVGDQVRIRYVESFALRVTKKAAGGMQVKESTTQPQAGKPSGKTAQQVTAVVRIEEVAPDGSFVRFTGPRGRRAVTVHDPAMRDYVRNLSPGDHVEVTYEEALALSLEKVPG